MYTISFQEVLTFEIWKKISASNDKKQQTLENGGNTAKIISSLTMLTISLPKAVLELWPFKMFSHTFIFGLFCLYLLIQRPKSFLGGSTNVSNRDCLRFHCCPPKSVLVYRRQNQSLLTLFSKTFKFFLFVYCKNHRSVFQIRAT